MAAPVIQASFTAGEISPHLQGRVDLNKYKIGAAKMENFIVDYKGGAAKRPGTRLVGKAKFTLTPTILVPFQFSVSQTYALEIGESYMRVITNGGYVLDGSGNIFEIPAPWNSAHLAMLKYTQSADTMTFVHQLYPTWELIRFGHADWRFRLFAIGSTVEPVPFVHATLESSGFVDAAAAAYTNMAYAVTAISADDGSESLLSPIARFVNVLDMTSHKVTANIIWSPVTGAGMYNVWKATSGIGADMPAGTRMGFLGSTIAESFTDSNILPNFTRSPPIHNDPFAPGAITEVVMTGNGSGYTPGGASVTVTDPTGSGAVLTPQVRDGIVVGALVERGGSGYTNPTLTFAGGGASSGSSGSGAAGVPFASGGIIFAVQMLLAGSGYQPGTIAVFSDRIGEGTGATGTTVISGGGIIAIENITEGNGLYVDPVVGFVAPVPPGNPQATGFALVGPQSGTYPGAVAYYQQRLLFAATANRPSTLWGSKPGSFHNFDSGIPVTDGDSYEFTLASQQLNAIKYMIGMPGGLVVLTAGGAWQLSGTQQFAPVTPTQIMATPQAFNGCGDLPPIVVGYEIMFIQSAGSIVRNLSYNFFANIYTGADVTVLSSHLFSGHRMVAWSYAEEPDKIIWVVRDDGKLLSFTFLKEQEVAGWSQHSSSAHGYFRSVATVREGLRDVTYFVVDRFNPTTGWYTAIEQLASRTSKTLEDAWYLDCALNLNPGLIGNATMNSGIVQKVDMLFVSETSFFGPSFVGIILRVGGGKYRVKEVLSPTLIKADEIVSVTETVYSEEGGYYLMAQQAAGTWDVTWETSSVGGLSHFEGQVVSILADGNVHADKVVSGGFVALDRPASRIIVGLNYFADLQTLRLESQPTVQGRRKKIPELTIRVADTRGLWAGMTKETLTEIKERDPAATPGVATPLITGDLSIIMDPLWNDDGQVWIRAPYPLPANILAVIPEVVLGDT